ncbi:hypothetical protein [Mycobacteroides abscessus]|uniref:hypothetical protein n=1 Tax=Mycobacteroides abscessus TaxID=36809 RepID=UPI0009A66577|nr:hypothetical protein [Mycobacteroides abscessus]SLD23467.1 Uncharacterised protein [Mycobacteroides abscessus subsp. massiliense]SLD41675.1 Uncharacterised protein [Mycobacteroides abscessus subsp. massiliense]
MALSAMSKYVAAAVILGVLGLGLIGQYPVISLGMIAAAGVLVWMSLQARQATRVERSRPTAARQARLDVQQEVEKARCQANRQVRREVEKARRQAQQNVNNAVERTRSEQSQRWVS